MGRAQDRNPDPIPPPKAQMGGVVRPSETGAWRSRVGPVTPRFCAPRPAPFELHPLPPAWTPADPRMPQRPLTTRLGSPVSRVGKASGRPARGAPLASAPGTFQPLAAALPGSAARAFLGNPFCSKLTISNREAARYRLPIPGSGHGPARSVAGGYRAATPVATRFRGN